MAEVLEILQAAGGVAGALLTLISLWGIISKKPKQLFRNAIRAEAEAANREIKDKLNKMENSLKEKDETDLALLRNTITHIYFKYSDTKRIPHYEKENVLYLFT